MSIRSRPRMQRLVPERSRVSTCGRIHRSVERCAIEVASAGRQYSMPWLVLRAAELQVLLRPSPGLLERALPIAPKSTHIEPVLCVDLTDELKLSDA